MIRLDLRREPYWLDLGYSVSLLVRPLNTALVGAARAMARDAVAPSTDSKETKPSFKEYARAERTAAFLSALARLAIINWQGVGDTTGAPIPVTDAGIAALIDLPQISDAFSERYFAPSLLLDAEKNGSSAAPSGIGVAVPAIAAAVPTPDSPAPTADAA